MKTEIPTKDMEVDDFEARTASFTSWLKDMGIRTNPKMALADLRSEGRGRGVGMFHSLASILLLGYGSS